MTDKQFERFTNIIKAINKLSEKRKNIFDNQNMIITITDSKRFYIQIRMKYYKGKYNEQYIKDLIISKLKDIEKENKKLDFDNECGLDIVFEKKKNNKKARA
ncbi:hypothetical protein [Brachyspira aalborgi]|jgi:hypothetical protein|uniref:Uncharacterized protein n=1 Tax=Brachyspira aalborgi TaxID=29522 RepID=A0ABY3K6T4_9SPIR|nr:hypothetical protein [Brachyspira aalborgi]TXJ31196.1 hypothetical protein EPJ71_10705 [Brachyspira aalborgi]TXJ40086.1 hypothetical protein EPJ65_12645 [Brachyspira aalborgi]DAZ18888.1 MAG TPA: hypothetical protein [Caudoviricetes sp.]